MDNWQLAVMSNPVQQPFIQAAERRVLLLHFPIGWVLAARPARTNISIQMDPILLEFGLIQKIRHI